MVFGRRRVAIGPPGSDANVLSLTQFADWLLCRLAGEDGSEGL